MERSQKALKNVSTGIINKLVLMLLAFATRTVFIRLLGAEYAGVSSLYTNILSVLSLAELGLGNVLMFYLYSALNEGDEDKICRLVHEFKKIYYIIIVSVLCVGILLIPFLQYIINSDIDSKELILYYLLYLLNSVASYFVVYRTTVISADQKSYIQNTCSTVSTILMYILQIGYLLISKNFLGYLIIQVCCTIGNNLVQNYIACKKYPYLKRRVKTSDTIINKKDLFRNIKATFLYKIADTILDQTDSIIISIMFGTIIVGYYSNYYMIVVYLVNFASIIVTGLVASFGNLYAEGSKDQSYSMFRVAMLLFSVYGIFCTNCYACIVQDFIPIWVGSKYVMDYSVIIAILSVFYLRMVTNTMWMYRSAMGLFKEVQYVNLVAAGINVVLSIVLGKWIGVSGVIVATAISRLLSCFWYEGKIVFKKFEKPVRIYYLLQLKDFITMLAIVALSLFFAKLLPLTGIVAIATKIFICILVTCSVELIVNGRSNEFKLLLSKVKSGLGK